MQASSEATLIARKPTNVDDQSDPDTSECCRKRGHKVSLNQMDKRMIQFLTGRVTNHLRM